MQFLDDVQIYDCIVVGIGGHGSAIVANLAKSGLKVLGLEQFSPVHNKGSSHGRTRVYRQAYFEDPKYVPLLRRSLELWWELDDFYKTDLRPTLCDSEPSDTLLHLCGGVMIGTPDSEVVSGVMRSIVEHEMPHEVLSATAMRQKYPQFKLSDDEVGVYEANAGYLMAELCVESYIALARKYGADLHFEEAMLDWWSVAQGGAGVPPSLEHGVQVRTAKGTYFARKLVLSVGAWAPSIYGALIPKMQLYIERRVLFWFQASEQSVDAFKNFPIYIWDMGPSAGNFYGFPSEPQSPGEVKVAFHLANSSPADGLPSPEAVDRVVHSEEVDIMRTMLSGKIPDMNNELLKTTTCMYTTTKDGNFIIDFHPDSEDVVLVSPCSGHGFKFISVVGEIVGDLVRDGRTQHDISLFSLRCTEDGVPLRSAHESDKSVPCVLTSRL